MIRRKSDSERRSRSAGVDDLVAQLEAGSGLAGSLLASRVRSDPEVLDHLAASAASGSERSLELLLSLIVELGLIGPATSRLTNDKSMIEDIEQDVLVEVARSIPGFRGEAKFTTWLYSLARNVGIAHLRRSRPTTELPDGGTAAVGVERRRMSSQVAQRQLIHQAISSLPPTFRLTVLLRDVEGLSYIEIAERQGLSINTVRSRLSRGRAMLATKLS